MHDNSVKMLGPLCGREGRGNPGTLCLLLFYCTLLQSEQKKSLLVTALRSWASFLENVYEYR